MTSAQVFLSEFLQYDLYHSIGAYSVARDGLADLEKRMTPACGLPHVADAGKDTFEPSRLLEVTRLTQRYNDMLAEERDYAHRSEKGEAAFLRRPIPDRFPLTLDRRFAVSDTSDSVEDARRNPWGRPIAWGWVLNFYDAAIVAIDLVDDPKKGRNAKHTNPRALALARNFARGMVWPRDVESGGADWGHPTAKLRRRLRRARFQERVEQALRDLPGVPRETPHRSDDATEFLHRLATDNLSSGSDSVSFFVVSALADAHLTHHAVEAWQSMSLGAHAAHAVKLGKYDWETKDWLSKELDRCIVLNTFVYCAARCAPWMFGADDAECKHVFENFPDAWESVVPARCIWIATQISLLALHRRAYSYALKDKRMRAYNDYYKLQRQIRGARRRVDCAPLHISGALEFLTCLEARSNQNIGELYRAEHAQRPALKHFQTALDCLGTVDRKGEMDEVLTNSRWLVELQLSQGKASYEMGRHKDAIRMHLEAWRAFLVLLAAETRTETNTRDIGEAIAWLKSVRFEPEIRKGEIRQHLTPVADQLTRIQVDERLGSLASEILLRLGHVLLVLNLEMHSKERTELAETLSFRFLAKALECDPRRTLVAGDLGKHDPTLPRDKVAPVAEHWPGGSDDYERVARVAEYLTLLSLEPGTARKIKDVPDGIRIAEALLLDLFVHTDSINVRSAQTHRFLMKQATPVRLPKSGTELEEALDSRANATSLGGSGRRHVKPAIEFVCMRRYSSAFPLLPRPSAFRAHGGGYFVRLHPERVDVAKGRRAATPVGVVVDPGPDFVENLFRADFSLADVDLIIVTHDHVDHLNSLEQLLSLLNYRRDLIHGGEAGKGRGEAIPVYGNKSICLRYRKVKKLNDNHQFKSLKDIGEDPLIRRSGFRAQALSSAWVDKQGHIDLSDKPSYGICFRHTKANARLAITSDVPAPRGTKARDRRWRKRWRPALEADVLVVHVSTVPPTEIRQIAQIDARQCLHPADVAQLINDVVAIKRRTDDALTSVQKEIRQAVKRARSGADVASLRKLKIRARALEVALGDLERAIRRLTPKGLDKGKRRLSVRVNKLKAAGCSVAEAGARLRRRLERIADIPVTRDELLRLVRDAEALAERAQNPPSDASTLERIRGQLQRVDAGLEDRFDFAMWLKSRDKGPTADLVGLVRDDAHEPAMRWRPRPKGHPYLRGTLRWAGAYRDARGRVARRARKGARAGGLLVLGEFSEELGTARGKIASRINETMFEEDGKPRRFSALSSDVGLRIVIVPDGARADVRILCTTCDLDTDRTAEEIYHRPDRIYEVCVKGENEGIFYNCTHHDPGTQQTPLFLEQLERFDVFGR
jgi:tetratricopeptide (TPR) repeat protein